MQVSSEIRLRVDFTMRVKIANLFYVRESMCVHARACLCASQLT